MILSPKTLPVWVAQSIFKCAECKPRNVHLAEVCGWHENLAAAALLVDQMTTKERKQ
jgi:hypothetical protein